MSEEHLGGDGVATAVESSDAIYLKAVTELGDIQPVVTSQDIYSKSGIKLVNQGVRIDSSFYERLVRHKLVPAIDRCLTVENAVSTHSLIEVAEALLGTNAYLSRLAEALNKDGGLRQVLSQIELNPPLAFKLTVAREKRPEIYGHSLKVMLISLYLGIATGMRAQELVALVSAALFHDLGVLHIDPALLDPHKLLSEDERRHLYAHPLTAYMMLSEFPEYHPHISAAVLEHHERMDGSGYPRGLSGERISRIAQVLAVAEVAVSRCDRNDQESAWGELEVMLKLNTRQFGEGLIGPLAALYRHDGEGGDEAANLAGVRQQFDHIAQAFNSWDRAYDAVKNKTMPGGLLRFVQEKLAGLKLALFDAGFCPVALDSMMSGIESDPHGQIELAAMVQESAWQLGMLIREAKRRWPIGGGHPEEVRIFAEWAEKVAQTLGLQAK